MSDIALPPVLTQPALPVSSHKPDTPAKIHDAAQQFEALLIGQILQSVSDGGGWMGSGGDSASSCATGFAQEQLATMMAKNGGFGLAHLIATGLERADKASSTVAGASSQK